MSGDDRLRDRLAQDLAGKLGLTPALWRAEADAALSTAKAYAAEELRMAADALERQVERPDEPWGAGVMAAVEQLYDRVHALGGQP